MTDKTVLDKIKLVPDAYSDELLRFVDYLLYKDTCTTVGQPVQRKYDFDSYKLDLPIGASLVENLATTRSGTRY
ncbi:MAG: hypothetical protein LBI64_04255 [Coriobacteriales bacterium]|jgi:hypothetical protein|nr:hypothetical protein [Coriobacteriales bacterium]